jgi:hypothetical protein
MRLIISSEEDTGDYQTFSREKIAEKGICCRAENNSLEMNVQKKLNETNVPPLTNTVLVLHGEKGLAI